MHNICLPALLTSAPSGGRVSRFTLEHGYGINFDQDQYAEWPRFGLAAIMWATFLVDMQTKSSKGCSIALK
jgi:hypothetical protein